MSSRTPRELIEGRPVLVVIDIQGGGAGEGESAIPFMPGYQEAMDRAPALVAKARECGIPIVFFQEAHRRDLVDFGRELDGAEDVHLLEGDPGTEIAAALGLRPDDYVIRKRRYSCFFGTELEILLKGLRAETLILIGGHTDVCVHYTFVDAHQHDYFCRVVEDAVAGSSVEAHAGALRAMEYLQTGARCSSAEVLAAFESAAS
ncbi:cysteine hydrolase [Aeromicrobium sp. A1-2]|uniref:cysteine hydrolase family protein n=1 Tax=Aeromicrobium sp. A1-2 TaxID=2107713 RepID=UPI000E4A7F6B|nr:cysteine hydrolase [Aeromicrobium sp. A1-2]AXT85750.1 cysteine hydrolase [Aeromicrobium sp. A1-2]